MTQEDLDNCPEKEDGIFVGKKEGSDCYLFQDPLHAFKVIATKRFRNLEKEYKSNADLLNLKGLWVDLCKIATGEGNEFHKRK